MRVHCIFAIGVFLTSSCNAYDGIESGADLRQRFLREAPECWSKMREVIDHLEGIAVETNTSPGMPAETRRRRFSFFFEGKLRKIEVERIPDTGARTAYVISSEASFEANRNGSSEHYYLGGYGMGDGGYGTPEFKLARYLRLVYAGETINLRTLSEMLRDNSSSLTDISEVTVGNRQLVRVAFEIKHPGGQTSHPWALLEPLRQWRVMESGEDIGTGTCKNTVEYQTHPSGVPFPKRVVTAVIKNGAVVNQTEYVFDEPRACNAAASEFTLAAYGLPPVPGTGSLTIASRRLLLWLVPTLLFVVVVFVLKRLRRAGTH